ncbi:MAG: YjfB family protein [Gammaproteobacteria bacterium]|jgi:ferritin-like metal-binding protein YciE|nr:YjfB family protein [Gammaproteobacteria bacterium]MBU1732678.1 YjfB family protein [Gammaproteobacteria bacterium]MBU1891503.1 YjfB family protein [Gammaproteobacteria bacterium]
MNVNMNTSTALASMAGQATGDAVGVSVLKKALQAEAQNAQQLINSVPQPEKTTNNLPPNLGQNINTTA